MFTALIDTCVLWPNLQRDFLLSLAAEGMYRPIWSSRILAELQHEEERKQRDRGAREAARARAAAQHLVAEMRRVFPDAEVTGWEGLEGTYGLPDPDDEHVVAAAVVGGAGAIVTLNSRDFPEARLPPLLDVIPPAVFASNTVALDPVLAGRAVVELCRRRIRVPLEPLQALELLHDRYGMAEAVALVREALPGS